MAYTVINPASVRSGPGMQYRWLRNLAPGGRVEVVESDGQWMRLESGGWVQRGYLRADEVVELEGMTIHASPPTAGQREPARLAGPPFVRFIPRPSESSPRAPPLGARGMWGHAHPRYPQDRERHFTQSAMERHHIEMERRAAARAMGRLHATLMFLARRYNPDDFPRMEVVAGGGWRRRERISERDQELVSQFDEARAFGQIRGGQGRTWASTIPSSSEFLQLERYPDFREDFNEAVREQWTYLRDVQPLDEILLIIVQELVTRGVGRAAEAVAGSAARAALRAGRAAVNSIRGVSQAVFNHVRMLMVSMRRRMSALADVVRRITGSGRNPVPVNFYPATGRGGTLPGLGTPVGGGTLRGFPPPPGQGVEPTLGRNPAAPPALTDDALSPGGGHPGRFHTEPLTAEQAESAYDLLVEMSIHGMHGPNVPRINATWGSSAAMLESYGAKWAQFAGWERINELPPHGFRVLNPDGSLHEICLQLVDNPHPLLR